MHLPPVFIYTFFNIGGFIYQVIKAKKALVEGLSEKSKK
jgi:hypothetical protein